MVVLSDPVDPIAQAAAAEAGIASPAVPGAAPAVSGKKTYPSPFKYEGHRFAQKINAMLDKADLAQEGDLLSKPAATVMVGECALATGDALGLTTDGGDESPIHPGWLLLCAFVAYAVIIGIQHWLIAKAPAKPVDEAEREVARAGLA